MTKKAIIILFTFLCANLLQAQAVLDDGLHCDAPEYTIMVNGKLPLDIKTVITFDPSIYKDTIIYHFYYNFKRYSYGNVWWSEKFPDLCSIVPDTAKVYLEYQFREIVGDNDWVDHFYRDTLSWCIFYGVQFVNITDINKKHYYINYVLEPPVILRRGNYDKKKYGNYRRFIKKVYRGWYPTIYFESRRPHGKPHSGYF